MERGTRVHQTIEKILRSADLSRASVMTGIGRVQRFAPQVSNRHIVVQGGPDLILGTVVGYEQPDRGMLARVVPAVNALGPGIGRVVAVDGDRATVQLWEGAPGPYRVEHGDGMPSWQQMAGRLRRYETIDDVERDFGQNSQAYAAMLGHFHNQDARPPSWSRMPSIHGTPTMRLRGEVLSRKMLGQLARDYAHQRGRPQTPSRYRGWDGVGRPRPNRHDSRRWLRAFVGIVTVAEDALLEGAGGRPRAISILCQMIHVEDAIRLTRSLVPQSDAERAFFSRKLENIRPTLHTFAPPQTVEISNGDSGSGGRQVVIDHVSVAPVHSIAGGGGGSGRGGQVTVLPPGNTTLRVRNVSVLDSGDLSIGYDVV